MSNGDRKNGVPTTVTSIPLVDPNAMPANPSIGDLVKDATTQVSTLVRAEVELAKAEITRDVKKGLTGSLFFVLALVVLFYSTFFLFFFLAELLDTWLWRWVAFLIVFVLMVLTTAVFAPARLSEGAPHPWTAADHRVGEGDPRRLHPGSREGGPGAGGADQRRRPTGAGRPVRLVRAQPDPSVARIDGPWRHLDVHANGIRFHCVEALPGPDDTIPMTARPLVILLHGFGSFWWSWRHQLQGG